MWTRRELKEKAKVVLKQSYWKVSGKYKASSIIPLTPVD